MARDAGYLRLKEAFGLTEPYIGPLLTQLVYLSKKIHFDAPGLGLCLLLLHTSSQQSLHAQTQNISSVQSFGH